MPTDTLQGRYELIRPIGSGGMAQVWEARDVLLERMVAVKVVDLAGADDPTLGERLRREAVATAMLAHPDVVTVYDAGVENDRAYFVMELVPGQDLAALVRQGHLPVAEAVRLGARIAGALAAAHAAGIVHRDIKPANVVVNDGNVTVVDFGIAAVASAAQTSMTTPGTVLGTAAYVAPERAAGDQATPASDMYSFGCLLMTLLTGSPPYAGEQPLEILRRHVDELPPRVSERRPEVPGELDQLVAGLLAKDPRDRPTADDAARVLSEVGSTTVVGSAGRSGAVTSTKVMPAVLAGAAVVADRTSPARGAPPVIPVSAAHTEVLRPEQSHGRPVVGRGSGLSRRWAALAAAVVLVLAVVAVGLAINGREPGPSAAVPPAGAEGATEGDTAGDTAGGTAGEEDAAAVQPPAEPVDPSDFGAVLAASDVDDETRDELAEKYEKVTEAVGEGKERKALTEARDLSRTIDELVREGQVTVADGDALRNALVAEFGPEVLGRGGGNGGKGGDDDDDDDD